MKCYHVVCEFSVVSYEKPLHFMIMFVCRTTLLRGRATCINVQGMSEFKYNYLGKQKFKINVALQVSLLVSHGHSHSCGFCWPSSSTSAGPQLLSNKDLYLHLKKQEHSPGLCCRSATLSLITSS